VVQGQRGLRFLGDRWWRILDDRGREAQRLTLFPLLELPRLQPREHLLGSKGGWNDDDTRSQTGSFNVLYRYKTEAFEIFAVEPDLQEYVRRYELIELVVVLRDRRQGQIPPRQPRVTFL